MKRRKISVVLVLLLSAIGMEAFAHNAGVNNLNKQPTATSMVIANTEFYYTNSNEVNGYACLADKKYHLHRELNNCINEYDKGINSLPYDAQFDLKSLVETHIVDNQAGTDQRIDEDLFSSMNLAYRFFPIDYSRDGGEYGPIETLFLTLTSKDELGYYNGVGYFNQVLIRKVDGEYVYEKREDENHMNPFGGEYALANHASLGRQPIVRVELYSKNNPDMVYAAGYLKLEIDMIVSKDEEICDNFYTCQNVIVANLDENEADNDIQLTWDQIQEKLNELNVGEGISPMEWNTYQVVEDEQYVYDETTNELVLINKEYSADFPYYCIGTLVIESDRDYGIWSNTLKWSLTTDDYKNLYYELKTRVNGIDWTTRKSTIDVKRYFKLHSPDSSLPDLYFGFTIPAGKLQFDGVEIKLERLQAIADDCNRFVKEDLANGFAYFENVGYMPMAGVHALLASEKEIRFFLYSIQDVATGYISSINNGSDVTWDKIEKVAYDWEHAKNVTNSVLMDTKDYYFFVMTVTCSGGGCVNIDNNDFIITNDTKSVGQFYPKAFEFGFFSDDYYVPWPGVSSFFELSVIPDEGYHVKSFLLDGVEQTDYTIWIYGKDRRENIVVEFEPDTNLLEVEDASVVQGGRVTVPVGMTNEDDITAFQFELELPVGFSVQDATLTARKSNHTMSYSQLANGNYQFAALSLNSRAFSGNEGALVNVVLKADGTVAPGDYTVKVKNIELTTTDEQICVQSSCSATLTVSDIKVGDANGDGKVSITDAVAVVNKVLGKPSASFRADAADVTGDGRITITDAVAIVNIVLGRRSTNARMRVPQ